MNTLTSKFLKGGMTEAKRGHRSPVDAHITLFFALAGGPMRSITVGRIVVLLLSVHVWVVDAVELFLVQVELGGIVEIFVERRRPRFCFRKQLVSVPTPTTPPLSRPPRAPSRARRQDDRVAP